MSKLDDILDEVALNGSYPSLAAKSGKKAIKDLMLELIGENESVSQAEHGTDWDTLTAQRAFNYCLSEVKEILTKMKGE